MVSRRAGFWAGFWFAYMSALTLWHALSTVDSMSAGNAGWAIAHALIACSFAFFACLEWSR